MHTKRLAVYNDAISGAVNNQYRTLPDEFVQPMLAYVIGTRTSGKSYLASVFLKQSQKHHLFDRVYIITPSMNSNRAYFGEYISPEDVFEPTKSSIADVIKEVEKDCAEWETYLEDMKMYKQFKRDFKHSKPIDDYDLVNYYQKGFFKEAPVWKYYATNGGYNEPPKSLLILDDVIGTPAISQSSGLSKLSVANRHVAGLREDFTDSVGNIRSACGLAVIILSQSYRFQNGIGRVLRENLSLITLFKNKQPKQMEAIREELGSVIDMDMFDRSYEFATREAYGSLTIDFKPKCVTKTFRKNLSEVIIFPELGKCTCK
jgi:hypothetical protein